jgi:hypothetical protein
MAIFNRKWARVNTGELYVVLSLKKQQPRIAIFTEICIIEKDSKTNNKDKSWAIIKIILFS